MSASVYRDICIGLREFKRIERCITCQRKYHRLACCAQHRVLQLVTGHGYCTAVRTVSAGEVVSESRNDEVFVTYFLIQIVLFSVITDKISCCTRFHTGRGYFLDLFQNQRKRIIVVNETIIVFNGIIKESIKGFGFGIYNICEQRVAIDTFLSERRRL